MIRVVGGKYKRTLLNTLEGDKTRPTRDMVREALFSSIQISSSSHVLDLFSGSGAIGIEALSRGAEDCVFNDINPAAVRIIRANLEKVKEKRRVYNGAYDRTLKALSGEQFDFVYIDPPYAFEEYENIFEIMNELSLLSEDAVVVVEVVNTRTLPEVMSGYVSFKEKRYGINKLIYYKKDETL